MLFHTNFENPDIYYSQMKMMDAQKPEVAPKKPAGGLQFTVRSILPKREPKPKMQPAPHEHEVRLTFNDDMHIHEQRLEKKRQKRRKYKKDKKDKLRKIKNRDKSDCELMWINEVKSIATDADIELDFDHEKFSNVLNYLKTQYDYFNYDGDALEL